MRNDIGERLADFCFQRKLKRSKGGLSVMLVVTRFAIDHGLPLNPDDLLAKSGTQVRGTGASAISRILNEHGITRQLAKEGGRTSRGSVSNMQAYAITLNSFGRIADDELREIESWWVAMVREFFAANPLHLSWHRGDTFTAALKGLMEECRQRESESPGTSVLGAVMQHLVGAKIEIILGNSITHESYSTADAPTGRSGDFEVGSHIIHVTSSPGEGLLLKCRSNLDSNRQPIVITLASEIQAARSNSAYLNLDRNVEIIDLAQFLSTNLLEWSHFQLSDQERPLRTLLDHYNAIVDSVETDPGLRIEF